MRKIGTKILIVLSVVALISALPITLLSINAIFQFSKEQGEDFGEKSAYYNATIIRTWMDEKSSLLMNIKEELTKKDSMDDIKESLYRYSEINDDFISLFIGLEDNRLIDAYGWLPDSSYKVLERPWYTKAYEEEATVATSTYLDWNKNENVVAMATTIEIDGYNGVLATNVYANYIEAIINDIKYGNEGLVYLLDDQNHIMIESTKDNKSGLFGEMIIEMEMQNINMSMNGTYDIEINKISYITSLAKIDGYDWTLLLVAPLSDFTQPAKEMVPQYIIMILILIVVILWIDFMLSKIISRPINALIISISKIAKGDFNTLVKLKGNDEITQLGKELDKMRRNLRKIFESNEYESKILAMNSKALEDHLNETYKGTYNFMSLLSHDIKTPITLIKGYSKAMMMDIVDEEKKAMYIERISYRAEQIEAIATDILDDTLDVNSLKVKLSELNIKDYINMLIYNSEIYINNQERKFIINIDDLNFNDEFVKIDVIKIQRVVNNILSNAVKFSDKDSIIELSVVKENDNILTYYKDFGMGVESSEVDKIFNMFYKSDEDKKGYGLGLYINKAIITAHSGKIHFKSQVNQYTESGFILNLYQ